MIDLVSKMDTACPTTAWQPPKGHNEECKIVELAFISELNDTFSRWQVCESGLRNVNGELQLNLGFNKSNYYSNTSSSDSKTGKKSPTEHTDLFQNFWTQVSIE